jgi:hypothetical protein
MKLIFYPIIMLLVIALISILLGNDLTSIEINYVKYDAFGYDYDHKKITFDLDPLTYGISFLTLIITSTVFVGVMIVGSGLQESSVRTIIIIVMYLGLWISLSILALDLLFLNAIIGGIVYSFLCLLYIIGVSQNIAGS